MGKKNVLFVSVFLPLLIILGLLSPLVAHATTITTVNLGTAQSFVILAGTEVTNVPTSILKGDVGLSPAAGGNYAGLTSTEVTGVIYSVDAFGPAGSINNPGLLTTAKSDLTVAYLDIAGRTPTQTFSTTDNQLGGQILPPGVYAFGHADTANITAANPLILDAQGDPNAVFIFQASSDLVTAAGSMVAVINGAQACNVFWQVTSSATLGVDSTFIGTILALTSITVAADVDVDGGLLARNAAVTLISDKVTKAVCIYDEGTSDTTDDNVVPHKPIPTGIEGTSIYYITALLTFTTGMIVLARVKSLKIKKSI